MLVNSEHNIKIQYGEKNKTHGYSGSTNGEGGDSTVEYNPSANPDILTVNYDGASSNEPRPFFIGLGHELTNSFGINNTDTVYSVTGIDLTVKNYPRGVTTEELVTVGRLARYTYGSNYPTENALRIEHDMPLRCHY